MDRRANRACRVTEIALRREERVTVSEIAAIFRWWLAVLERNLEPQVYFRVVPELRKVTSAPPDAPSPDWPGAGQRGAEDET